MNWAKKLLTAGDCPRCGGRLEDLGDGQVSCDTCSYPEPEEDERIVCDVCGRIIDNDGEHSECLACGVSLCSDEKCRDKHIAERCTVPSRCCDYCGRDIDPGETWTLETRDGTEHFCCAECQHERAAEIEAAPLCAWCHEKCDRGVVHPPDSSVPFCSTDCAAKFRASSATGRCDDCERDSRCDDCPGYPGGIPVNPFDPENVPFTPIPAGSSTDAEFLESGFAKAYAPFVTSEGQRYVAVDSHDDYYPAVDGAIWFQENGRWKRCRSRWR